MESSPVVNHRVQAVQFEPRLGAHFRSWFQSYADAELLLLTMKSVILTYTLEILTSSKHVPDTWKVYQDGADAVSRVRSSLMCRNSVSWFPSLPLPEGQRDLVMDPGSETIRFLNVAVKALIRGLVEQHHDGPCVLTVYNENNDVQRSVVRCGDMCTILLPRQPYEDIGDCVFENEFLLQHVSTKVQNHAKCGYLSFKKLSP